MYTGSTESCKSNCIRVQKDVFVLLYYRGRLVYVDSLITVVYILTHNTIIHQTPLQLFFHQLTHAMSIILLIIGGVSRPGIMKLFPARESLISDIPAGNGKIVNRFYSVFFALFSTVPFITKAPSFVVIKQKQVLKMCTIGEGWSRNPPVYIAFIRRFWKSAKIIVPC